jgi:hypothetical protein
LSKADRSIKKNNGKKYTHCHLASVSHKIFVLE